MTIARHSDDAACTMAALWDNWIPASTRRLISSGLPGGEELGRKLAIFVAAGHDIGKLSAAFGSKQRELYEKFLEESALETPPITEDNQLKAPHSLISQYSLMKWLGPGRAPRIPLVYQLAEIVGAHHGRATGNAVLSGRTSFAAVMITEEAKDPRWEQGRRELWERAAATAGLSEAQLRSLAESKAKLSPGAVIALSGLVTVADWIASNTELFPLEGDEEQAHFASSSERASNALAKLKLPRPWSPSPPHDPVEMFASRFPTVGAEPRDIQKAMVNLAQQMDEPGMIVLEAPTGDGKTEAALMCAEVLAHKFGLGGVTLALPTCATADAALTRVLPWLDTTASYPVSTELVHHRRRLHPLFRSLQDAAKGTADVSSDVDSPSAHGTAIAHWWMRGARRNTLASVNVGTIDQTLLLSLASKHLSLRHIGAAGRVLIIDEVHAADDYMMVYLRSALEWVGAMGVPTIVMSATLPTNRRQELLDAYLRGCEYRAEYPAPASEQGADVNLDDSTAVDAPYPRITSANPRRGITTVAALTEQASRVEVVWESGDDDDLAARVVDLTSNGGCALVIRNTVRHVQNSADKIRQLLAQSGELDDCEVIVLHSRMAGFHRSEVEQRLQQLLGKGGDRPKRLIVVASQVAEQSLDIDADVLFTDIAPVDLIIQRAGRMHRHRLNDPSRPERLQQPRIHIWGTDNGDAVPTFDGGSKAVYGEYALLRAVEALRDAGDFLQLPAQAAPLVERAYDEAVAAPAGWEQRWEAARLKVEEQAKQQQEKASTHLVASPSKLFLLSTWCTIPTDAPSEEAASASVRDIEQGLDVIVLREHGGHLYPLFFGSSPSSEAHAVDGAGALSEDAARAAVESSVRLNAWITHPNPAAGHPGLEHTLREREGDRLFLWERSPWLRGRVALVLDENLSSQVNGIQFTYSQLDGLLYATPEKS